MGFVNKIKNKANLRRSISNRIRSNKKLTKKEKAEPASNEEKQRYNAQVNLNPKGITIDSLVDVVDGLTCGTVTTFAGGAKSVDMSYQAKALADTSKCEGSAWACTSGWFSSYFVGGCQYDGSIFDAPTYISSFSCEDDEDDESGDSTQATSKLNEVLQLPPMKTVISDITSVPSIDDSEDMSDFEDEI